MQLESPQGAVMHPGASIWERKIRAIASAFPAASRLAAGIRATRYGLSASSANK